MTLRTKKKAGLIFLAKLVEHMIPVGKLRSWHVNSCDRVDQEKKREGENVLRVLT